MKNLYKFYFECGRMRSFEGNFRATSEEVKAIIEKTCYFGEVLGKYSEIYGTIEEDKIELISDNQEFLSMADKLKIDLESGFNPLNYYTCSKCGNPKDVITDICESCQDDNRRE